MNINWKVAENQSPIIYTRKTQWNGIGLRHWNVLAGEMEETAFNHHEISLPFRGSFTTTRLTEIGDQQTIQRTPGTLCVVPAYQPISFNWEEQVECVTMQLDPALLARIAAESSHTKQIELRTLGNIDDPFMWQIGLALLEESQAEAPVGRLYAESLANTLAFHLLKNYTVNGHQAQSFVGGLAGNKLRRATEFINANLSEDVTLSEIAETVELSPYHFSRAFKRTTGLTPQQYLMQRRVERAKQLLSKIELPIVEISAQVGFKNQSHFTTFFRRLTSMTPKAWRETQSL
jgi:AraC family transcriptional regulator